MIIEHIRLEDPEMPPLHGGVLVAAFSGWNDAGEAATGAVDALADLNGAAPVGDIDPEEFYDFQVHRPRIRWQADERVLDWPANDLRVARRDDGPDLLLLSGVEPNVRWRTFVGCILDLAEALGVQRVLTLGALQVDVPHTRPVPITGSASTPALAALVGVGRSSYEGPTGIVGVLHQTAIERGLEAVTMWAGVPHYLAGTTYHVATLRLVEALAEQTGTAGAPTRLRDDAAEQLDDVAELVADDDELASYVAELETRSDVERAEQDEPLPQVSGDQIAADIERYLRGERGGDQA